MYRGSAIHRLLLTLLLLLIHVGSVSSSSNMPLGWRGSEVPYSTADHGPFLAFFPELRSLPAPTWIREGLRVYYRSASGSMPNNAKSAAERSSRLVKPAEISAMSPWVVRIDVAALTTRQSVTCSTLFLGDLLIPWDDFSTRGHAGVGDFWVNPIILRDASTRLRPPLAATDLVFEVKGKPHNAVRIDYNAMADQGVHYVWVLDSESGLLLYHALYRLSADRRNVNVSVAEFSSKRQIAVPWAGHPVPAWMKPGIEATYAGQIRTWVPAGSATLPIPAILEVKVRNVGPNWTEASIQRVLAGDKVDANLIVHTGSGLVAGGLWIHPTPLSNLREGQRLDAYDPEIRSSVEVSYVGVSQDGAPIVALFEWGRHYKRIWIYRTTDGMLLYWSDEKLIDPVTGMVQRAEWQLRGVGLGQ